jgi:hypothetical protein
LNTAHEHGAKLAVVGKSGIDFDGNEVVLTAPHFEEFSMEILSALGTPKSAIDGGCVYSDGSFSLVSHGLLDKKETEFRFVLDKKTVSGKHTGLLAFRKCGAAFATKGSELFIDDIKIDMKDIEL